MRQIVGPYRGFCERYRAEIRDYYFSAGVMHELCIETGEEGIPDPSTPYHVVVLVKRKGSKQPPEQRTATEWFPTKEHAIEYTLQMLTTIAREKSALGDLLDGGDVAGDNDPAEGTPGLVIQRVPSEEQGGIVPTVVRASREEFEEMFGPPATPDNAEIAWLEPEVAEPVPTPEVEGDFHYRETQVDNDV